MMQYPLPLRPGARIGLIAPSGPIRVENGLDRSIDAVKAQGFQPVIGDSCGKVYGHLSGTDEIRANDINRMFADDSIEGIFCIRGGYGAPRILHLLDFDLIKNNPKPFLGYSDVTALHVAFNQRCDLVTYHGPMPASDWIWPSFDPRSMVSLRRMLMQPISGAIQNPSGFPLETIAKGKAKGRLVGGNVSLISGLCGTPWALDGTDCIVFLEDIGEKTYHLDHMLAQLRSNGLFDRCAGVILGGFTDCNIEYEGYGLSIPEVVRDLILPSGKPILGGLQAGHCQPSLTLPLGAACELDATAQTIAIKQI